MTAPGFTSMLARADRENERIKGLIQQGVADHRAALAEGHDPVVLTSANVRHLADNLDKVSLATLAAVAVAMLADGGAV